jgi:hypothetical protein
LACLQLISSHLAAVYLVNTLEHFVFSFWEVSGFKLNCYSLATVCGLMLIEIDKGLQLVLFAARCFYCDKLETCSLGKLRIF